MDKRKRWKHICNRKQMPDTMAKEIQAWLEHEADVYFDSLYKWLPRDNRKDFKQTFWEIALGIYPTWNKSRACFKTYFCRYVRLALRDLFRSYKHRELWGINDMTIINSVLK